MIVLSVYQLDFRSTAVGSAINADYIYFYILKAVCRPHEASLVFHLTLECCLFKLAD